jgi:cell fate (sporulation/competence/biofilm development) regulator YlbF (YheA/YmcA/DUF963 family)
MKQNAIEKTYELVDEIKAMDSYQRLIELKRMIDQDELILSLISSFQKEHQRFEETSKYGKYHPDLKEVQRSFQQAKQELYTHPVVQEYKQLEKELQQVLHHVSKEIATAISSKIKHPNEFGLINKK